MYDLDQNGKFVETHEKAKNSPQDFVMKPQREGGGTYTIDSAKQANPEQVRSLLARKSEKLWIAGALTNSTPTY